MNREHGTSPSSDLSTVKRTVVDAPTVDLPCFALELRGPGDSATFDVDPKAATSRLYVGTSKVSDLRLTDPLVSRRHAVFDFAGGYLRVVDLESTNGSWANGLRFREVFLTGGEMLRFGDTFAKVVRTKATTLPLESATSFGRLLGRSAEMRRLYPLCERLALTDVPVVIEGETGTGKELLAECLHELGPRASGPFVVLDGLACLAGDIDEALYGHEPGYLPGTTAGRPGAFEQATGGTLLLDCIDDLDDKAQAKLLRILDRGEVQRLGSTQSMKFDVRLIVSARNDLESAIQSGRFREDLYYRLAVARVDLPALRQRHGDVTLLLSHFWTSMNGQGPVPDDLLRAAETTSWPGNVRELVNMVARRVATGPVGDLRPKDDAPGAAGEDLVDRVIRDDLSFPHARRRVLDDFERRYVAFVLAKHGGNVSRAAAASGIARRYFYVVRSRGNG